MNYLQIQAVDEKDTSIPKEIIEYKPIDQIADMAVGTMASKIEHSTKQ